MKEKLGKQDFHYDIEEIFEPVTENQKQCPKQIQQQAENQIQSIDQQTRPLRDFSQTITKTIQESTKTLNENIQKPVKEGIEKYNENTNRNNQLVTDLVHPNQVDFSIVKIVSNLLNTQSQRRLDPVECNPNLFMINPNTNLQQVIIKGSTITFQNGNTYNLNDPELSYFITKTQFDREIQNVGLTYTF